MMLCLRHKMGVSVDYSFLGLTAAVGGLFHRCRNLWTVIK